MTENADSSANVDVDTLRLQQQQQQQSQLGSESELKVKQEKIDAEIEQKLTALSAGIKNESSDDDAEEEDKDSDASAPAAEEEEEEEDKKAIAPVKTSNEILAELFSVFNAAPPEELLNDKSLLKRSSHKKVKKEKKVKRKKPAKSKSDGECSESERSGEAKHKHKHKHKRKKHKHKEGRDKHKEKDREKAKSKDKEKAAPVKLETRKRPTEEAAETAPAQIKKERQHNSFYNGYREQAQPSKELSRVKIERRLSQSRLSDVSLSDEETFLQGRRQQQRQRQEHNSFYSGVKEEPRRRRLRRSRSRSRTRSRSRDLGIDKKRLLEIARKNAIQMFKRGSMPGVADLTPELKDKVLLKMRYGGRTVQDLTEFCKKISNGNLLSDLSSDEDSDVDKNGNAKAFHHPFQLKEREPIVMHIRNATSREVVPLLPRKEEQQTKAISMFPVSSGQHHRASEVWVPVDRSKDALAPLPALPPAKQATTIFNIQKNVFAKPIPHQQQQEPAFKAMAGLIEEVNGAISSSSSSIAIQTMANAPAPVPVPAPAPTPPPVALPAPVPAPLPRATTMTTSFVPEVPIPSTAAAPPPPASSSIFPQATPLGRDVSSIITQRLSAIRRLQDNPTDSEAIKMMYNAQRDMSSWASSKHLPGQFTGSTGAHVMKVHELNSGPQVWARRDQLTSTKPVTGGMGMALLQKMGWKPGEGLGRAKTGSLQPLLLDVKLDKRGLVSREDINYQPPRGGGAGQRKNKTGGVAATALNAQDKHPVCVLNELTSKNKWTPPQYKLQNDSGPAHNRMFLFSVDINGQSYTPPQASNTKKEAKLNAAKLCLRSLGILPPS